jgi:hypothetical protein
MYLDLASLAALFEFWRAVQHQVEGARSFTGVRHEDSSADAGPVALWVVWEADPKTTGEPQVMT